MATSLAFSRASLRGWRLLTRERGWGSMLMAVLGILLLVQLLTIAMFSVQAGVRLLQSRSDVRLEVRRDATSTAVQEFYSALRSVPAVATVEYVSRDQALARETARDPSLTDFLEQFGLQNPFPDSFRVTLTSLSGYDDFAAFVSDPKWAEVVDPSFLTAATAQHTQLRQMLSFLDSINVLTTVMLTLCGLTLLIVTAALVHHRVLQRTEATRLQCLLGGRPFDVLFPFVWETSVLLVTAVLLSGGLVAVGMLVLPELYPDIAGDPLFASLQDEMIPLFRTALPAFWIAELIACPILAFFAVALGVQWKPASPVKARR